MIGLWLLGLVAGIAWLTGYSWLIGLGIIIILILLSGVLSGLAGVSRRRKYKEKYHPIH